MGILHEPTWEEKNAYHKYKIWALNELNDVAEKNHRTVIFVGSLPVRAGSTVSYETYENFRSEFIS